MVELHKTFQNTKQSVVESFKHYKKFDNYIVVLDDDSSVFNLIESVLIKNIDLKKTGLIKLGSIDYCYHIFDIIELSKLKLFVLDLCLPSGNIIQLINHIQSYNVPIFIYSGSSNFEPYHKYKDAGVIDFFKKGDYTILKEMGEKIKKLI